MEGINLYQKRSEYVDKKRDVICKFEINMARIGCDNISLLKPSSQGPYWVTWVYMWYDD